MIFYEFPFNERIRTYLRLEHLYKRLNELVQRTAAIDHHYALLTIFEILEIVGRAELKTDVLKDLERQKSNLIPYRGNASINEEVLNRVIDRLGECFDALNQTPGRIGALVSENDWLMSVRSRAGIPGGTCSFDLPIYYAWQHQADEQRCSDLKTFQAALWPMYYAIVVLLSLIRDNGSTQKMLATAGYFQKYLEQGKPYQLVRIGLDETLQVAPEITVNRLLVIARLMNYTIAERPTQTTADVAFELTLCQ